MRGRFRWFIGVSHRNNPPLPSNPNRVAFDPIRPARGDTMARRRYTVMAWRRSMIRVIILGFDLKRGVALNLAAERFETGAYHDVEVRLLLPGNVTKLVKRWTKDKHG
jgi:hypothetical protein